MGAHPNLEKMLATRQATRERRTQQRTRVFELKLVQNKLSSKQAESLALIFIEAKWLYNSILARGVFEWTARDGVQSKSLSGELTERKLSHLHAHVKQNLHLQMKANIKSLASNKNAGRLVGALKFKSQVSSVEYSTGDLRWTGGKKVFVPKLGWIRVAGAHQLLGKELGNARLVKKAGSYYLKVTCFEDKNKQRGDLSDGSAIGIDMGVSSHVTLSDGTIRNILVGETERLKGLQRKLSRQTKGSNNYGRTRTKIQREHARMDHLKNEAANKLVHELLSKNEWVFYQDESLSQWKVRYGKKIQHSILGRLKSRLANADRAFMVAKWVPTTQWCPGCNGKNKLPLQERTYVCSCGVSESRDVHAAKNMIRFGLTIIPPEQRVALVERMLDSDQYVSAALLSSEKQATVA